VNNRQLMISRFLRDQAWWRLDCAGASALRVARSVVALLDAAAYAAEVPDDHPDLRALTLAGCFRDGVFDPGEEGLAVVRGWQLADRPTAGPADLLAAMADVVGARVVADRYTLLTA
jgi:hypothetical protein